MKLCVGAFSDEKIDREELNNIIITFREIARFIMSSNFGLQLG